MKSYLSDNQSDQLNSIWHKIKYFVSRFTGDRCSENAAALTYMSLFALVPLLTVLYTMASAVPAFQGLEVKIQDFLFENLVPETSSEIEGYLNNFSQQAKNLTGVGIGFLTLTAVLMLRNIEKAFNLIWRARENRSPVSSFLLYWAVLSLAPLTIGLALGISTYVTSLAGSLGGLDVFGAGAILLKMAPFILSTIGFTLIYAAVPNCPVPIRHALIGGLVAASAFNIARFMFTKLFVGSSYTFIYGAFAAVPLFLLWIYISWNIVLTGGILVHSMSAYQTEDQATRPNLLKALDVLYYFWRRQQQGLKVKEIELLRSSKRRAVAGLDSETWQHLRDLMIKRRLITLDEKGDYLLSRDLSTVSYWQLKEWVNIERVLKENPPSMPNEWQESAYALLINQRKSQREILDISLTDLFKT